MKSKKSFPFHLAQINVSKMIAPLSDPLMAGFVEQLPVLNALADDAPGFVWRLQGTHGDATGLRSPLGDDILVNVSVWTSLETMKDYAYKTAHLTVMRDRKSWFARLAEEHLALWWIPAGHLPTLDEAVCRLQILREQGETAEAFTFRKPFPAPVPEIQIVEGYVPGVIGVVSALFATYFAESHGFGLRFEAKVATELADFLEDYDSERDLQLVLKQGDQILGGISVDGRENSQYSARLRWFILSEEARGDGWGRKLLDTALEFCRAKNYGRVYLTTVAGLEASRQLYEKYGFRLASEIEDETWGTRSLEQTWIRGVERETS